MAGKNLSRKYTHPFNGYCLGLRRWVGTRKVKPIWILLKQETASGSGISWAICKSAPHSRQITMPAPHHSSFFTGRMPFLPPNQQHQSTEGIHQNAAQWSLFWKNISYVQPFGYNSPNEGTVKFLGKKLGQFPHLPENRGTRQRIQSRAIKITPCPWLFVTYPRTIHSMVMKF